MASRRPFFEVYQDRRGQWRWRLRAANGRIIADSGEGYTTKKHVKRAIQRIVIVMAAGVWASFMD